MRAEAHRRPFRHFPAPRCAIAVTRAPLSGPHGGTAGGQGDRRTGGQRDEGTDGGTEGQTLGVTGVEPRTNNAAFSSEPSRRIRELPGLRASSAISTAHVYKLISFLAVITPKYFFSAKEVQNKSNTGTRGGVLSWVLGARPARGSPLARHRLPMHEQLVCPLPCA